MPAAENEFDKLETPYHSVLVGMTSYAESTEADSSASSDSAEPNDEPHHHRDDHATPASATDPILSPARHSNSGAHPASDDSQLSADSSILASRRSISTHPCPVAIASSRDSEGDVGKLDHSATLEEDNEAQARDGEPGTGGPLRLRGGAEDDEEEEGAEQVEDEDDAEEDDNPKTQREMEAEAKQAKAKAAKAAKAAASAKRKVDEEPKPEPAKKRKTREKRVVIGCECGELNPRELEWSVGC